MSHDATACEGWDGSECEGTVHCPPRCPRFVDKRGARWTIRPAVDGDAAALAELYEAFGTADRAQGLPPVTRSRRADWIESMLAEGSNVVAERDGELFGHAMYTPTDAAVPELAVFVHPDAQDRGVGTELCRHVIANAAAENEVAFEINLGGVLRQSGGPRVRKIANLRKLRELIEDAGAPFVVTGAPHTHLAVRGPRELVAVGSEVGFEPEQIEAGLENWQKIAERNRARLDPRTVRPGVRLTDEVEEET